MSEFQVGLVADDPLARVGLAAQLAELPGCVLQLQTSSGRIGALLDDTTDPDLIVWDVGWELPAELPDWAEWGLPVIALLANEEDAATVWASGVRALLPRVLDGERLATAVAAVQQGFLVIDPSIGEGLLPEGSATATLPTLHENLTPRESEVLQLLAEGLTNKAIAQRLAISDHTVKFHVNAIMGKLSAQSRTEAVVRATRLGLILL